MNSLLGQIGEDCGIPTGLHGILVEEDAQFAVGDKIARFGLPYSGEEGPLQEDAVATKFIHLVKEWG